MRNFIDIVHTLFEAQSVVMYHGTLASNIPSILKHGLIPSDQADASAGRWATLGGVYLTDRLEYAAKAAKIKAEGADIAIVVVRIPSLRNATPDEDVVEKALIKAFTKALDMWGVDDAYEADLEQYARAEEERPLDPGEKPFNRKKFFKEFWTTVCDLMSEIAGAPRRRDLNLIAGAVDIILELEGEDKDEPPSFWDERRWQEWQAIKHQLIMLYPRLRNPVQYAKSDLTIPHNIRFAKRIPPKNIVAVLRQDENGWKAVGSFQPNVETEPPIR